MEANHPLQHLTDVIRNQFAEMSPQFQSAARYLLDNPQEVAVGSMRNIAAQAGVQPATMVRFAQSLGFDGWSGLREIYVSQVRAQPEPYAIRAKQLVNHQQPQTLITETFTAQCASLQRTGMQRPEAMLRASKLLVEGKAVHVAGFRACYSIAFAFHYLYRFFRSSVTLLNGEGGTLEQQLRAIGPDDVTVVISFAPYSQEARAVANTAKEKGCRLIAITDSMAAPIALLADETILFYVTSPSFFPSIVAGVAVAETLLEMVVSQSDETIVSHIHSAEQQLHDSKAYTAS